MSLAILGLGTAVPETVFDQSDASRIARSLAGTTPELGSWLTAMYNGTEIRTRRTILGPDVIRDVIDRTGHSGSEFVPTGQPGDRGPTTGQRMRHYAAGAPPLAEAASRKALERSGVPPRDITHLITVSCTGFLAPGIDVTLIQTLNLRPTVERTHVGYMGCHGALNGLRAARAFANADSNARVLLCAVELCSLHYHYGWDSQRMIANAIFGDGAAALVGGPGGDTPREWQTVASGSCLIPDSANVMTWTVSDHGFEMTLSKRVPGLIAEHLKPWLAEWLGQHGIALDDVRSWAIHPGGPRILAAAEEALGLPRDAATASRAVFAEFGNMSSPTLLFILDRLRSANAPRPCVAVGFGPGLTAEAALFR
jgi:predicted naringenin-chalcone synthase